MARNYTLLRQETDLPSYQCRDLAWKVKDGADAPVGLPKDSFDLRVGNKLAPWFISIPTPLGRVHLPLRMAEQHARLLSEVRVADSLLSRRGNQFFVHLVIQKEVHNPPLPNDGPVLAVDLGERVIATSVAVRDDRICSPRFYGRRVRGIRRHYAWLRRRLGERKLLRVIRRLGNTEQRKVEDALHKISKAIVQQAASLGAVIALGDLSGVRRTGRKGRRFNRIVNDMPYGRLSRMVQYKAAWMGIPVIGVREDYSSMECRLCHEWGRRPSQGLFICRTCGDYNADINGAVNIGKRALAYMAIAGVPGFEPERRAL